MSGNGVSEKPSGGKVAGVFFLCWVLAFVCCVFTSMMVASGHGFSGYSRGGLSMLVIAAICAGIYGSSGKAGVAVLVAAVAGAAIGFLAVQLALF